MSLIRPRKIVILGTGGTIAGTAARASDNVGYVAAQVQVTDLLRTIPGLEEALDGCELVAEQVAQLDSKDMGFQVWRALAQRCAHWLAQPDLAALVVTHGTDTLEETAWFLQSVLHPHRPVVLTCAMRPATALAPDGPQNVLDALAVALDAGSTGVLAVCAGVVHSARDVQKVHPYRLDAFGSGDAGPLAYVEERRVRWVRNSADVPAERCSIAINSIAEAGLWPRVEIVMNYAGAGAALVDVLVATGAQGLVAACTGNGTLHHELEAALLRAQARGVRVVRATRCALGQVLARPGASLPDSAGLSPVKARVTLMLELMAAAAAS